MSKKIILNLGDHSYPIILGAQDFAAYYNENFCGRASVLVTNDTIAALYKSYLEELQKKINYKICIVQDGEKYKTVETWSKIVDAFVEARLDRKSVAIAFGGGVVGDMTGFAAACYMRGIDYVQIPTTLLAMVDSSVGGKTAVDHPSGKNLIGAFHQPAAVWVDTEFLKTLPRREFVAGYAEAFKYGFLGGREMFDFILNNRAAILAAESAPLLDCIERSIRTKAEIVAADEREAGVRALLNFGHTFAHALEQFFGFEGLLHGEAVLHGMVCAVALAKEVGALPAEYHAEFDDMLDGLPLPPLPAPVDADAVFAAMFADKKAEFGKLRFILPIKPGESAVKNGISDEAVLSVIKKIFAEK